MKDGARGAHIVGMSSLSDALALFCKKNKIPQSSLSSDVIKKIWSIDAYYFSSEYVHG